ncbi:MAG TPA: SAM-dependent methyltransferase, partial [Spirochaetota bacterium]|nr:SAM-dependent methyltransferase [Spirochaetota bacterium]
LKELNENAHDLDIKMIESDICNYASYAGLNPELIVCMGDTLTHLAGTEEAELLIKNAYSELTAGGKLVLSFRDYSNPLTGAGRFIPVYSGENYIFTCFLEYSEDSVNVYDIVHERIESSWVQKISTYKKTIIRKDFIEKALIDLNFKIELFSVVKGLIAVIAVKN